MKVIQADALGMCFGVRDALDAMRAVETPTQVTVFGQLVHNPLVGSELDVRGFKALEESRRGEELLRVRTPRVLITAHGISDRQRALLVAQGKDIIDTTCPLVRRAHAAAVTLARAGYYVLVIGRRGHVEVAGLTGDLPAGGFEIVENPPAVRAYARNRIGIIAQTTTVDDDAHAIVRRVRDLNPPPCEVRFANTICQPTRDRQAALDALIEKVDVLVVVGGRHSNNTRHLVTRARAAGLRAVHVEGPEELAPEMFAPGEIAGLTAGTSTLPETIAAVRQRLECLHARPQSELPAAHSRP